MKNLFKGALIVTVVMFGMTAVFAQSEIIKWEGYGGYSYMNLNRGIDADEFDDDLGDTPANRVNAHGFNGSITYNFHRFVGAKFDLTLHSYGEDFTFPLVPTPTVVGGGTSSVTAKISQNVYQYMGGIQIKDNQKEGPKFRPFAHILLGLADQHFSGEETSPGTGTIFDVNSTDWAMKFGGGLDWEVHKNVDVRLIQFDWNPIFRGDQNFGPNIGVVNGTMQNNWLIGVGVVLKK